MNVIPMVFAFNYKVTMPAGVCFTSLLRSAKPDTFYHFHIMHGDGELNEPYQKELKRLKEHFTNFDITFINIGNNFDNVYVARGIPKLTYYKIVISDVITQYDRAIFSDVDIIFTADLWDMFSTVNLETNYFAAAKAARTTSYMTSIGCEEDTYVNCGFLVYNLKALRSEPQLIEKQKALCGQKWTYFDQDILNKVFKDRITFLPLKFNATYTFFMLSGGKAERLSKKFSQAEIQEARTPVVIHYTGNNPWKDFCPRHDIWWQHYRESIYYDPAYYFDHYYKLENPTFTAGFKEFFRVAKKNAGNVYKRIFAKHRI